MQNRTVAFVAFHDQDNLGVGYISSVLLESGFRISMIDFREGPENILKRIESSSPLLVGFSIIFQYQVPEFRDLVSYLRQNGVRSHFTAGGHYPSLRPRQLFELIPELDSVVMFEGEYTCRDLAVGLRDGGEWRAIKGLSYMKNGEVVVNELRPLEDDLDRLPIPVRRPPEGQLLGRKMATLLAGRGCYHNCSFCSIRKFYSTPPGPLKRIRRPDFVAKEMQLLHEHMDCSLFFFQDDDFPVSGKQAKGWIESFCRALEDASLVGKILWKISCRPDEIDANLIEIMRDHGMFAVYLGIESGSDSGLRILNKHLTTERIVEAVKTINDSEVRYEFGFMLFDPSSTFDSVIANLDFLDTICGDGSSPVAFCKMLPYAETAIEDRLIKEGRLKGDVGCEDYSFLDPQLDRFFRFFSECFMNWIRDPQGVHNLSRKARLLSAIAKHLLNLGPEFIDIDSRLTKTVAKSNRFFTSTSRQIARQYQALESDMAHEEMMQIGVTVAQRQAEYSESLSGLIAEMNDLAGEESEGAEPPSQSVSTR